MFEFEGHKWNLGLFKVSFYFRNWRIFVYRNNPKGGNAARSRAALDQNSTEPQPYDAMARGKDPSKPQRPKGIRSSLEWRRFKESKASDQYRAIRGIEKLGGPVNSNTPRTMSQCTNHLGKSGCMKLAYVIAPYVTAKAQEVKEVTNEDAAKKVHAAVVQFCESHNVNITECEPGEPMPICYNMITGLSPEAAVLFWVLTGAPNADGTPLISQFKRSGSEAKKARHEESEGGAEESSVSQEGSEEEDESSEDEKKVEEEKGAKGSSSKGVQDTEADFPFPKDKDRDRGKGSGAGAEKKRRQPKEEAEGKKKDSKEESEIKRRKKREERFGTSGEKGLSLNPEHAKPFDVKGEPSLLPKDEGETGPKRKGPAGSSAPAASEGEAGLAAPEPRFKKKRTADKEKAKGSKDGKDYNEPEEAAEGEAGEGSAPVRRVITRLWLWLLAPVLCTLGVSEEPWHWMSWETSWHPMTCLGPRVHRPFHQDVTFWWRSAGGHWRMKVCAWHATFGSLRALELRISFGIHWLFHRPQICRLFSMWFGNPIPVFHLWVPKCGFLTCWMTPRSHHVVLSLFSLTAIRTGWNIRGMQFMTKEPSEFSRCLLEDLVGGRGQ